MTNRLPKTPIWIRLIESALRLAGGGRMSLNADRLIGQAGGVFDDRGFRAALDHFCEAFDGDGSLNFVGRRSLRWMILDVLKRRHRVERDVREHPEIAAIPIVRPIFVLGQPRTGTTFLQQLLALDPECRWLRPWEVAGPYPEKQDWGTDRDPRLRAHKKTMEKARDGGGLETIHSAGSPAECWQLLWASFVCHTIFLFYGLGDAYQRWQAALPPGSELAAYRFYRLQLQHLMWIQPAKYWVLKAPEHTVHLPALLETFPDAILVQLHRDPCEFVPSMCSLAWYCQYCTVRGCEEHRLGAEVVRTMAQWNEINVADRAGIAAGRVIDLEYRDLVESPAGAVARIYEAAGIDFNAAARGRVGEWVEESRRVRRAQHQYSLEQFGVAAADLQRCCDTRMDAEAAPVAHSVGATS